MAPLHSSLGDRVRLVSKKLKKKSFLPGDDTKEASKSLFSLLSCISQSLLKRLNRGLAEKLIPVILALWEDEAGRSQGQEFKTNLTNVVKPHLY